MFYPIPEKWHQSFQTSRLPEEEVRSDYNDIYLGSKKYIL